MKHLTKVMTLIFVTVAIMLAASTTVAAKIAILPVHTEKELNALQKKTMRNIMANIKAGKKVKISLTYKAGERSLSEVVRVVEDTYFRYYGRLHYTIDELAEGTCRINIFAKGSKIDYLRSEKNRKKLIEIAKRETRGKTTMRDMVRSLNNYVCRKLSCSYDKGTLDDALWGRVTNCLGYAELFLGLCDAIGIPGCTVYGYAGTPREGHVWCRVKLSKLWYYIDPAWNDTTGNKYTLSRRLWPDHEEWTRVYTIV